MGGGESKPVSAGLPIFKAERLVYDSDSKEFVLVPLQIKVDPHADCFAQGGMRDVFYAYEVDTAGETLCVVKVFRNHNASVEDTWDLYANEAFTQSLSDEMASCFHRECEQRGVGAPCASFVPCSVGIIRSCKCPPSASWGTFFSHRVDDGRGDMYFTLEPFIEGKYVKYNDNSGRLFTDFKVKQSAEERAVTLKYFQVAEALSHFSYDYSGRAFLVCDIQGIKMMLSDPQILANPDLVRHYPYQFGRGNTGKKGIARWTKRHTCNDFCKKIGLFDVNQPLPPTFSTPDKTFVRGLESTVAVTAPSSTGTTASTLHRPPLATQLRTEFSQRLLASTSMARKLDITNVRSKASTYFRDEVKEDIPQKVV